MVKISEDNGKILGQEAAHPNRRRGREGAKREGETLGQERLVHGVSAIQVNLLAGYRAETRCLFDSKCRRSRFRACVSMCERNQS
jgi:hypothetical protein